MNKNEINKLNIISLNAYVNLREDAEASTFKKSVKLRTMNAQVRTYTYDTKEIKVLVSYTTPVAILYNDTMYRVDFNHSISTAKQINAFVTDYAPSRIERVSRQSLQEIYILLGRR